MLSILSANQLFKIFENPEINNTNNQQELSLNDNNNSVSTPQPRSNFGKSARAVGKYEKGKEGNLKNRIPRNLSSNMKIGDFNREIFVAAKEKDFPKCMKILNIITLSGFVPNFNSYAPILESLNAQDRKDEIALLTKEILSKGLDPEEVKYNYQLHGNIKTGNVERACSIWHQMHERGYEAEAKISTDLLKLCVQKEDLCGAEKVLKKKNEAGIALCLKDYNSMMNLYAKKGDIESFEAVWKTINKIGLNIPYTSYNIRMHFYAQQRDWQIVVDTWNEMLEVGLRPDIESYHAKMKLCMLTNDYIGMEMVREEMAASNIKLSLCACITLKDMYGYESVASWNNLVISCIRNKVSTYNDVFRHYDHIGDLEGFLDLWDKMLAAGEQPDAVAYTAKIKLHARYGDLLGLRDAWIEMEAAGIKPDVIAYTTLMQLCQPGSLEKAWDVRLRMQKMGVKFNLHTYSVLLDIFINRGYLNESIDLFNEMLKAKIVPNSIICNTMMDVYLQLGLAEKDKGFAEAANHFFKEVPALFEYMEEEGIRSDWNTYDHMRTYCVRVGDWNEARVYSDLCNQL